VAYRLKRGESVKSGVKRIAREELGDAVENLRRGEIHEARKHLKKVRALLRLMRYELGAAYRTENARLREVGLKLSPVRDAEAMIEAVDRVQDRPGLHVLRTPLERHKREVEKSSGIAVLAPKLADVLDAVRTEVGKWPLNGQGWDAVDSGVEAAYRKGREALERYLRTGRREDEHEWRKRVKDHWYHVRLLENLWNGDTKDYERELKQLEDALGEDLNLAMLREHAPRRAKVEQAIDVEQSALRDRALEIGERIYASKPKKTMKQLRRLWQ
jgi:CHAD domain-containing protein